MTRSMTTMLRSIGRRFITTQKPPIDSSATSTIIPSSKFINFDWQDPLKFDTLLNEDELAIQWVLLDLRSLATTLNSHELKEKASNSTHKINSLLESSKRHEMNTLIAKYSKKWVDWVFSALPSTDTGVPVYRKLHTV